MTLRPAEWEAAATVAGCVLAALAAVLLARRGGTREPRRPGVWAAAAALVAFAIYAGLALGRFRAYNSGEDLGRIDQAIWSVLQGRPLVFDSSELGRPMARLAGHVELLYVALAPLFWLWDSAAILLLAQALLFAAGAWPAYRLGRRAGGGALGLAAAIAYLAHPAAGYALLDDIHGDTLAVPLLLLALERGLAGRRLASFAALALAVAAKEYVAVLAITTGIYWLVRRRDLRLGLASLALGAVWLLAVVPALHARFRPPDYPAMTVQYFEALGATPLEVAWTGLTRPDRVLGPLLTPRTLGLTALLLAPLAFAPLASPAPLLVVLPIFVPLAFTPHFDLRNHHHATLLPFLLLAAVEGARRVTPRHAAVALLASAAVAHVNLAPSLLAVRSWTPGRWDYLGNPHLLGRDEHDQVLDAARALLPRDARVSVSGPLVAHLSHRPTCHTLPAPPSMRGIDWIVADLRGAYHPAYRTRAVEREALRQALDELGFALVFARDGVFVAARQPAPAAAVEEGGQDAAALAAPVAVGPLRLERDGGGALHWTPWRDLAEPLLVLDDAGAVRIAPSLRAPVPWPRGLTVTDPEPLAAGTRLRVLVLHEGFPALDPRAPPQPWLPDPFAGERVVP